MNIGISPAILALLTALLFLTQGAHAFRDPETGTFITRDPAGFVDGPNVYGYVRQNPWTKFDPHGLYETGGADPNDRKTPRWISTNDKDGKSVLKFINGGEELRTDSAVESFNAKQSGDWSKVIARMERMAEMEKNAPGIASMNYQEVVAGADPEYNAKLNSWADTMAAFSPGDMVNPNRSPMAAGGKAGKGNSAGTSARDVHEQNAEIVAAAGGSSVAKTTKDTKTRPTKGADGGTSEQIIERDASGEVISKTHIVTTDGKVVHQHQDHQGKHGGERRFPDEWVEHPEVNAPTHVPRPSKDNSITDEP